MTKKDALTYMRIAGYHSDQRRFTRLLIENRVSRQDADEAYQVGQKQKLGGMKCACHLCK